LSKSTVYLKVNRVDSALCAKALQASVSDLHEAYYILGGSGLMSSRMRPNQSNTKIAGPAVTAQSAAADNLMMHRSLSLAQAGDVLVVTCPNETSGAQWGDVAARYALKKGLAGVVIHGSIRDTDMLREIGSAAWSTHVSPRHPDKQGHGTVNAPIVCDGVLVNPGDLIMADGDGVICIDKNRAPAVVELALTRMNKENELAQMIANGQMPWDLSGASQCYKALGIEELNQACDD
jgi:4-hydroxy-4-methyl-2-oxoglutarate aldolase